MNSNTLTMPGAGGGGETSGAAGSITTDTAAQTTAAAGLTATAAEGGETTTAGQGANDTGASAGQGGNIEGAQGGANQTAAAGLLGNGDGKGSGEGNNAQGGANFTDEQYAEGFNGIDEDVRDACAGFMDQFREAGLSPAAASKLAQAWADRERANFEKFEDDTAARAKEYIGTWTAQDRTDAAAALRQFIKPDSYLDMVIKHSPVGNDPDFLNLLKTAGLTMRTDNAAGAGAKGAAGANVSLSRQLGIEL